MAFERKIRVVVGRTGQGAVEVSALDLAFRVSRSIGAQEATAEVTFYNAKEATRVRLVTGATLQIEAGYGDDAIGTIFIGMITQASSWQSGVDWVTELRASTFAFTPVYIPLSMSYAPHTSMQRVLSDLGQLLNMVVTGGENVSALFLPNGWVYAGTPYEAIVYCRQVLESNGYGLFVDNNELVVYRLVGASTFTAAYLDYNSGLLAVKDVSEPFRKGADANRKRVSFQSLLNWRIRPNSLVRIDTSKDIDGNEVEVLARVRGTFLVEKVEFQGDTFGGAFTVSGEASA